MVRKLKGGFRGNDRDAAEGVDDVITYSVLAAEGFLPGHGLTTGTILAMAEVPYNLTSSKLKDFDLPRPPNVALREYVPGNLIYANGQKFTPRHYTISAEEGSEPLLLNVIAERGAIREATGSVSGGGETLIKSIPICDVQLVHRSRVSDDEPSRFLLPVTVFGRELGQHSGGKRFNWGNKTLQLINGLRMQLVNVGPTSQVDAGKGYGYPICGICGQSVSPFSSDRQKDDFFNKHEEWHARRKTFVSMQILYQMP